MNIIPVNPRDLTEPGISLDEPRVEASQSTRRSLGFRTPSARITLGRMSGSRRTLGYRTPSVRRALGYRTPSARIAG